MRARQELFGFVCKKSDRGYKKVKKKFCDTKSQKQKHDDLSNRLESSQKKFGGHKTRIADC